MKSFTHKAWITSAIMCFSLVMQAQRVGIETETPDSTLSIANKVEIGGTHGDILFTDDLGSITFPATTEPNSPRYTMPPR